jgi:hypothetical protein
VLHPDELHDGAAATDAGLRYRIFYLAPELVGDALDRGELPFVADPVQPISEATLPIVALLRALDEPVSDLAHAEVAVVVADALRALAGGAERRVAPIDLAAVGSPATISPRTRTSRRQRQRSSE